MSRAVLTALMLLMTLIGCVGYQPHYLARDSPPPYSIKRVVLMPTNFNVSSPRLWTSRLDRTGELLAAELVASGRRVQTVDYRDALDAWQGAVSEAGGLMKGATELTEDRYAVARSSLARAILNESDADVVVLATVVKGLGSANGSRNVKWDGVTRRVEIDVRGRRSQHFRLDGKYRVSSLRLSVVDRKGRLIFEKTRGLEILESLLIDQNEGIFREVERTDLFQDEELLLAEIRNVLRPLFVVQ